MKILFFLYLAILPQREVLVYDVWLGPIYAGTMKLSMLETEFAGEEVYQFRSTLNSLSEMNWLFTLNDTLYSYVRKADFKVMYFEKRIHETNYDTTIGVTYDWEDKVVRYEDGTTYPLAEGTLDLVSIYYYFRLNPLQVGEEREVIVHADRQTDRATVRAVKETWVHSQASPDARYWCTKLVPNVAGKGSFGSGGNLIFYLTQDQYHMPALIKTTMGLGSITARLRWKWRST